MNTFYLEILSPGRVFYSGGAEMVVFPSIDGLRGVLSGHEPMVTALAAGELKFSVKGKWQYAAVSDGFAEIMPNRVVMLADTVELPEEINIKWAEEEKARAKELLRQKQSLQEYIQSKAALARAIARLKVAQKRILQ